MASSFERFGARPQIENDSSAKGAGANSQNKNDSSGDRWSRGAQKATRRWPQRF